MAADTPYCATGEEGGVQEVVKVTKHIALQSFLAHTPQSLHKNNITA